MEESNRLEIGDRIEVTYEGDPYYGEFGTLVQIRPHVAGFVKEDLRFIVTLENNGNKRIFTENEIRVVRPPSGTHPHGGGVDGAGVAMDGGSLRA